jgi:hypothetical protein
MKSGFWFFVAAVTSFVLGLVCFPVPHSSPDSKLVAKSLTIESQVQSHTSHAAGSLRLNRVAQLDNR